MGFLNGPTVLDCKDHNLVGYSAAAHSKAVKFDHMGNTEKKSCFVTLFMHPPGRNRGLLLESCHNCS